MTDTFKEKVQSMTGREIVLAMVEGLENPAVEVDMDTFGDDINGKCFGCAATNTICKISGKTFDAPSIIGTNSRADFITTGRQFLSDFEDAIDELRLGKVDQYNRFAFTCGIAQLDVPDYDLPILDTDNYLEGLPAYRKFAEEQK